LAFVTETKRVYCEVRTESLHINHVDLSLFPWRPEFDLKSVHVRFMVEKVALGQAFVLVLRFLPVSIIPPKLRSRLHVRVQLRVGLTRRTNGRSLGTFQKATIFRKLRNIGWKSAFS
jgi:hypothetical protein